MHVIILILHIGMLFQFFLLFPIIFSLVVLHQPSTSILNQRNCSRLQQIENHMLRPLILKIYDICKKVETRNRVYLFVQTCKLQNQWSKLIQPRNRWFWDPTDYLTFFHWIYEIDTGYYWQIFQKWNNWICNAESNNDNNFFVNHTSLWDCSFASLNCSKIVNY